MKSVFGGGRMRDLASLAGIAVAVLLILHRLLTLEGWPQTHDQLRYLYLFRHFQEAFASGIIYPRWLPDLYGGYGYPTFVFYQPLFFYACLLFSFFVFSLKTTLCLVIASLFLVGGTGAYLMARELCDRACAFLAVVFFLLTPYLYVNLYVRGDLSELSSIFLLPWPVYLLLVLRRRIGSGLAHGLEYLSIALVIALAAVITAHPATTSFFYPFFVFAGLFISRQMSPERKKSFLRWTTASVFMAILISSPYWFTAFSMKRYVHYEWALLDYFRVDNHAVYPSQLFSRFWGFGGSVKGIDADGMSFQLGLPHFALALAGMAVGRKNPLILASAIAYFACILLMLPPCLFVWNSMELLKQIQFPWRLLSVVALLQVICICGLGSVLQGPGRTKLREAARFAAYGLCIALAVFWYQRQFEFKTMNQSEQTLAWLLNNRYAHMHSYAAMNEMLPRTAKVELSGPRGRRPIIEVSDADCQVEQHRDSSLFHGIFRTNCARELGVVINQLYLPGWRVLVDDQEIDGATLEGALLPDGRMRVRVPPGEGRLLEFYYEGPPGWRLRDLAIVLALVAYLAFMIVERKRRVPKAVPA